MPVSREPPGTTDGMPISDWGPLWALRDGGTAGCRFRSIASGQSELCRPKRTLHSALRLFLLALLVLVAGARVGVDAAQRAPTDDAVQRLEAYRHGGDASALDAVARRVAEVCDDRPEGARRRAAVAR